MDEPVSNLTRFFRNSDQLKTLEYTLLPNLVANKLKAGSAWLKAWVIGCSTGEEVYTLAIILREVLPEDFGFSIVAVDRSAAVLSVAERGVYSPSKVAAVPTRFLGRYFEPTPGGYKVRSIIRDPVRFAHQEGEAARFSGEFDLVTCRNVLSYLRPSERALLLGHVWNAMAPCSWLVLGGSESLLGVESHFEYVADRWSSAYRKP